MQGVETGVVRLQHCGEAVLGDQEIYEKVDPLSERGTGGAATRQQGGARLAISTDGAIALIGASGHTVGNHPQGATYVFTRSDNQWSQAQILAPSGPVTDDRVGDAFGAAVAVSGTGDAAVIGSDTSTGASYVFARTDLSLIQRQQLASPAPGSYFGSAVAISADRTTVLIGASTRGDRGAVFVFTDPALPGA